LIVSSDWRVENIVMICHNFIDFILIGVIVSLNLKIISKLFALYPPLVNQFTNSTYRIILYNITDLNHKTLTLCISKEQYAISITVYL